MATEGKVRQFLEVSDLVEQMKKIVQQICEGMKADFEKHSDDLGATTTEVFNKLYNFIAAKMDDLILSLYKDFYTDEELDELIIVHSSSIFQKMRERTPEITNRLVSFLNENQEVIENEAERLFSEAMEKFTDLEKSEHDRSLFN